MQKRIRIKDFLEGATATPLALGNQDSVEWRGGHFLIRCCFCTPQAPRGSWRSPGDSAGKIPHHVGIEFCFTHWWVVPTNLLWSRVTSIICVYLFFRKISCLSFLEYLFIFTWKTESQITNDCHLPIPSSQTTVLNYSMLINCWWILLCVTCE